MNERARMQLRLQWTVEGLSVAAISYYVVGLLHYLFNGLHEGGIDARYGFRLNVELATALAVPIVMLLVALVVRQIRRHNTERRSRGTK